MKLLLIQPSHLKRDGTVFKSRKLLYPGLALPIIAALTPPDFDIRIINEYSEKIDFDEDCDLVGLTSMTPQVPRAYQIAEGFRKRGKKVVMGGFHVTFLPDEAEEHCDSLVMGEAEYLWPQVIEDFRKGDLKARYFSDERVDLKDVPTPRYDLINMNGFALQALPVQTTRGCPRKCDFCSVTEFYGGSYRFRPVENVVRDVRASGARYIFFIDDNIAASSKYMHELCDALRPLDVAWGSQCNVSVAKDPDLLRAASRSGCFSLFLGIESVNQESLAQVNKSFNDVGEYEEAFRIIKKAGIAPMVSMMLGMDGDDEGVFKRTLDFLVRNRIPIAYFFIMTPGPTTRLFEKMDEDGRILTRDWSRFGGDQTIFQPQSISPEALDAGLWDIYDKFYSTPSIIRRLAWPPTVNRRKAMALKYNILHQKSIKKRIHPLRG